MTGRRPHFVSAHRARADASPTMKRPTETIQGDGPSLAEVARLQVELTTMRDENDTLRRLLKTARFDADVRLGAMNEANERRLAMSDERDAAQTENEATRLNCKALLDNARRHEEAITARLAALLPVARAAVAYTAAVSGDLALAISRELERAVDDLPDDLRAELEAPHGA